MTSLTEILVGLPLMASILLKSTIILGAGWSFHFFLAKRNPRWRVLLWRSAIAGLLLIPILVPFGYLQVSVTPPPEPILQPAIMEVPDLPEAEPVQILQLAVSDMSKPSFSLIAWLRANIWMIVTAGWGLIASILTLRLLVGFLQVRQKVISSLPGPDHLQQSLNRVADEFGCKQKVALRYSSDISTPLLTGLYKPKVILPERMIDRKY